jgi:TRAP-type C4-dicarboxylate transport system substrate-binding protein
MGRLAERRLFPDFMDCTPAILCHPIGANPVLKSGDIRIEEGFMRRSISVAAAMAALLLANTASAQELKLRAGVFVPINSAFGDPCRRFVEEVNQKGKGAVQLQLLGPEAMPPFELGNAVGSGVLDLACVPPGYYKGKMAESEAIYVTNIPFAEHRKTGAWDAINKLHNEKMTAQYLAAYGDGVRFHYYSTREIKGPGDFKGMKIRSAPNTQGLLNLYGATTVAIPPGEVYTALERGTIEAFSWPLWGIHDLGWEKFTKYRVDPGFHIVVVNVLMNLPKYKSLTSQQRKIIDDAALWLETNAPKWGEVVTATDLNKQQASGIKVIDFGPAWRNRANEIFFAEIEKNSPDNMKMLRKLLVKE